MTTEDKAKTLTEAQHAPLRLEEVRVEVVAGADRGVQHVFQERLRVGTRPLAGLVLKDPRASALHCELTVVDDQIWVRDLGSKNGTFLGNYRVKEAMVPSGELLGVGRTKLKVTPTGHVIEVPVHPGPSFFGLLGRSTAMRALIAHVERAAATTATVLIQGESGTGKECVARALHDASPRAEKTFEVLDCGAIPPNLFESELFGHERGAFTDARARFVGAFERSHGGTLFLDEVGEIPLQLQSRLLRALETGEVKPLGGGQKVDFDTRIIAATNRDLQLEVAKGRFREDLYHRLAVISLHVPPLRARAEDVPLLAVQFLQELGLEPATYLDRAALTALVAHDWPGNVRELRNTLERAAALMEPPRPPPAAPSVDQPAEASAATVDLAVPLRVAKYNLVALYEQRYMTSMLAACGGNVSEAARRSGMDRVSVQRLMQRHGLKGKA